MKRVQGLVVTARLTYETALIFVIAQAGGAIFPAITGVIASEAGVATLQPILVGLLAAMAVVWFLVPDPKRRGLK